MGITLGADQRWCWRAGRRNRGKMSQEQTWKSLVYNTNITPYQVHTFYKTWAETYEEDMNKLQFHSAGLLADMLTDALSRGGKNDVSKLRVLDVACGTGTVGDALQDEVISPLPVLTSAERCWTAPRRRLTRRGPCTTR